MTAKSRAWKRKFRAPRHTDPFWRATSSWDCVLVYSFLSSVATPWILCRISRRLPELLEVWGTHAHLSLTRWKSGLPAQVLQFVFGRRTIDCNGLCVHGALKWNFCWRYVTGLMKGKSVFGTSNFSIYLHASFLYLQHNWNSNDSWNAPIQIYIS